MKTLKSIALGLFEGLVIAVVIATLLHFKKENPETIGLVASPVVMAFVMFAVLTSIALLLTNNIRKSIYAETVVTTYQHAVESVSGLVSIGLTTFLILHFT